MTKKWASLGRRHTNGAFNFKTWLKSNPLILVSFELPEKLPPREHFEHERIELQLSAPGLLVRSANLARLMLKESGYKDGGALLSVWPVFKRYAEKFVNTFYLGGNGAIHYFPMTALTPQNMKPLPPKVKALVRVAADGRPYFTYEFPVVPSPEDPAVTFFT